jgi:ribonuclease P protein component
MNIKLLSLSKNEDFKSILTGKKVSNKYLNIFFKKLSDKNNKNLNISFIAQKKLGNAVKRNKIKRRLRNIMNHISKISKINLKYSYLIIAKQTIASAKFIDVKEALTKDYKKIK